MSLITSAKDRFTPSLDPETTYHSFTKTIIIMTKADLVKKISETAGLTAADAKKALDATTDAIKAALVAGEKIQLIGFGTFAVNERPAREGVNPANGQKIQIAAKKVAKFKAGADLEKQLNA